MDNLHQRMSAGIKFDNLYTHMLKRVEFVKAGSALGAKVKMPDGKNLRLNKRASVSHIPAKMLDTWTQQHTPVLYSSGTLKYENGKNRALYPVDNVHYMLAAYILDKMEPKLTRQYGFEETNSLESILNDVVERMAPDKKVGYCYDFDDFNAQHSNYDQSAIWLSINRTSAHYDVKRVTSWLADAHHNAWIMYPDI